MKIFKYFIAVILFVSIFSSGFAFTPYRIEPLDIRAEGMGSAYLADSESFFTLFSNPAGLAFVGSKTLFPAFVSTTGSWSYEEDINYDYHSVSAPLTFGVIKNNFGWGVLNKVFVDGDTTAPATEDNALAMNLGTDLALIFGYSFPLDLGSFGTLSIGFSGRGIAQARSDYTLLFYAVLGSDIYPSAENTTLGFGFDMGIQYEVLDIIDVAVVLQDIYTAVWTKNVLDTRVEGSSDVISYESPFKYAQLEPKLGIGIGLDLPVEKITDTISHLGIYIDYNNLWPLFKKDSVYLNPLLEFSVGAELVLFDFFALRLGMDELYPVLGVGFNLHDFRINLSLYSKELDERKLPSNSGPPPQVNVGISMIVEY